MLKFTNVQSLHLNNIPPNKWLAYFFLYGQNQTDPPAIRETLDFGEDLCPKFILSSSLYECLHFLFLFK
jgi:hypothetical protein